MTTRDRQTPSADGDGDGGQHRHRLGHSLIVHSRHGSVGALPSGTELVHIRAFPEGFDRFAVLVNVEGRRLELAAVEGVVDDPLVALPDEPDQLVDDVLSLLRGLDVDADQRRRLVEALTAEDGWPESH